MMKKILFVCLALPTFLAAQSVSKTMLKLPDTGETTSYTTTFGADNDYTINPPFFRLNGNGTVTDTVTGLMWQQTDGGEMTIENALTYCQNLNLGGYTNWRLPNAHEAFSILNLQRNNPALDNVVFTTTAAEYWWTSDRQASDNTKIWATNAGGGIGNHPKTETVSAGGVKKFHIRAVRDVTTPPTIAAHFTDNANGTTTDNLTTLVWQKIPIADTLTWEQALMYVRTLTLAGKSDWRLPNIKELQSINDETRTNPSLNTTFFAVTGAKKYWSSTTLPNQTTKAWYLDTQFGITTYDTKTIPHSLICVRGNLAPTLAVADLEPNSVGVYPNPFTTFLYPTSDNSDAMYTLYNSIGQVVFAGKGIQTHDFSAMAKGIYFLTIVDTVKMVVKLLKE